MNFIVSFQNVDISLYNDVSIFLSLYRECIHMFCALAFYCFFQNVDTSTYKDVSIVSSLYRNVSIFSSQSILLFSYKMWMRLYTRMFSHFHHCIGMYPHFSQGILLFLFQNVDASLFNDVSIFSSLYGNVSIFLARAFYCFTSKYGFISI